MTVRAFTNSTKVAVHFSADIWNTPVGFALCMDSLGPAIKTTQLYTKKAKKKKVLGKLIILEDSLYRG